LNRILLFQEKQNPPCLSQVEQNSSLSREAEPAVPLAGSTEFFSLKEEQNPPCLSQVERSSSL
jgi:hypothetical protein